MGLAIIQPPSQIGAGEVTRAMLAADAREGPILLGGSTSGFTTSVNYFGFRQETQENLAALNVHRAGTVKGVNLRISLTVGTDQVTVGLRVNGVEVDSTVYAPGTNGVQYAQLAFDEAVADGDQVAVSAVRTSGTGNVVVYGGQLVVQWDA